MRTSYMLAVLWLAGLMNLGRALGAEKSALENGYFRLDVTDSRVTSLECDSSGRGRYDPNKLVEMSFADHQPTGATRITRSRRRLTIGPLQVSDSQSLEVKGGGLPELLLPEANLGQSFVVTSGQATRVEVHLPTWATVDSQATLRLRRTGPQGEILAQRRLQDVSDNSWQELSFEPQGPGTYYVELTEAKGMIGWWSSPEDTYPEGGAFTNGQPLAKRDRAVRVSCTRDLGEATMSVELDRSRLKISTEIHSKTASAQRTWPLLMTTVWDNQGYEVSAKTVPFSRFFTDTMRYMPVQQLKRWKERDGWYELSLDSHKWIEADGTEKHDLRFLGNALRLEWRLTGKETLLRWTPTVTSSGDTVRSEVTLEVRPRDDTMPADWPRFVMPDKRQTEEANTFLWERNFTFGPVWGPAAWHEWIPLGHFWHVGEHLPAQRHYYETYPMSGEGYVHTWGGAPGWPFPDNSQYDTRHFDTNARFLLGSWRYAAWTGDLDFLKGQADRLRRAMEYQLTQLHGADGLIIAASKDVTGRHKGVGDNYWDILPFGHLDAYANVVWYASIEAMAQTEEMLAKAGKVESRDPARSPNYYRDLAKKARRAYNETFWDEEKGRYIGCVDLDGKRHDYGFTFVNLEAMAYGLASEQQVKRIYHWMETEPTSTGKADTYSAFIFAPRATTIHNPTWNPEKGKLEEVPEDPWWHFGWQGTPYADYQCQDGGAILYTSFFDLLARAKYLGPDNAWRRWQEILGRWRLPDHLCGGPPLSRGEQPQQINPGATGTDIPFPESGLVPCWLLYGVMGVQATNKGLEIAPRLPAGIPWVEARNMAYRGLPLDLRVTRKTVSLVCKERGHQFKWQATLGPEGTALFTKPPAPIAFPRQPVKRSDSVSPPDSRWKAHWIWLPNQEEPRAFFRYTFDLPAKPKKAWLSLTADNGFVLYVNGLRVTAGDNWSILCRVDLTRYLREGVNVITVAAENSAGPGGLVAQGEVALPDATKRVLTTDRHWKVTTSEEQGWLQPEFNDTVWQPASEYGMPPCDPWQDIGEPGPR